MQYDPNRHHRHSIRLSDWDYTLGAYFVTICVQNREMVFGNVVNGEMQLNASGIIVAEYWHNLPRHFPTVELGPFVVMPNHVHFIISLNPPAVGAQFVGAQFVGAQFNCAPTNQTPTNTPVAPARTVTQNGSPIGKPFTVDKQHPTLGQVVRAFKAATARLIRQAGNNDFAWQRNYYEHIIRNEAECQRIAQYIHANPAKWITDWENPNR